MQIYLGDLSHDTVGLATEVFPLNVAFVAAYAKKKFGDDIEIRLFKYIPDLEEAIENNPPDILGLSNYPWCENIGGAMFEMLAERRPDALRILGGPNFPHEPESQEAFLAKRPLIDAYTYLDGEVPFANIVELGLDCGDLGEARRKLKSVPVEGCAQLGEDGKMLAAPTPVRIRELDEIPSPFLTGLLDPFFDDRLSPMIQTHRGCPFKCTFCADGSSLVNRVNNFSTERIEQELNYIAERVPETIKTLHIADLNFGMYKRDADTCNAIRELKQKHNYPLFIDTATGKNSKKRIINAIEKLDGALSMIMSVQSMTPEVLTNIKRDNIRLADFIELKHAIKAAKLPTSSEIILGLPGETRESHLDSLNQLMVAEIENIVPYTLMLLNGSEMSTAAQRIMWEIESKYRVLPRDFTALKNGNRIVEVEEVVVATNSLSYEDYVYCRKIALLIAIFNTSAFKAVIKLLLQNDVPPMDVFVAVLAELDDLAAQKSDRKAVTLMSEFERETHDELWDSAEEVVEFFKDADHFQGLIDGTYGANLIQTYTGKFFSHCSEDFSALFFAQASAVLARRNVDQSVLQAMCEAQLYCKGIIWHPLDTNRLKMTPMATLSFDFQSWTTVTGETPLSEFPLDASTSVKFVLSEEQFRLVEGTIDRFGRSDLGIGKALIRINKKALWRSPVLVNKSLGADGPEKLVQLS